MIIGFLPWRALGCEKVGYGPASEFRCPLFATMEGMDSALTAGALPEGFLRDRTFRRAAPLTSLGELLEVGEAVRHSTPDFYEWGPTTSASFLREKTSTDAQVGGSFRFYEQPTIWKGLEWGGRRRKVKNGVISGLVRRLGRPSAAAKMVPTSIAWTKSRHAFRHE